MLLEYFVPGFIFITIFQQLTSRKSENINFYLLWSVIFSFIIKTGMSFLHNFIMKERTFNLNEKVFICTIVAFLSSLICVIISERKWFNNIFININHKSVHNDIWHDIVNYNGTTLKITCNNEEITYTGILIGHEEKGSDSWFTLEDYFIKPKNGDAYASRDIGIPARIVINLKSVDRIELFYSDEEKVKIIKKILNKIKVIFKKDKVLT